MLDPTSQEVLAKQAALVQQMRIAIGEFLIAFTTFDAVCVSLALRAISTDPVLVDHLHEWMELDKRLKLLRGMAEARSIPEDLRKELTGIYTRAHKLSEHRNHIAHNGLVISIGPTIGTEVRMTAGIQLPKSKRNRTPLTTISPEAVAASLDSELCTVEKIEGYTKEAIQLQAATVLLADRLSKYMRNRGTV